MNTFADLVATLDPVLELLGIKKEEYLIIGSAAEYIGGYVEKFGDVDIYVSPETFKRLMGEYFEVTVKTLDCGGSLRVIRVGMVDVIEHEGDWLNCDKDPRSKYPIPNRYGLIENRIQMGRVKDQVKAWQLIHTVYSELRAMAFRDPSLALLASMRTTEQTMFDFQTRLMELGK